MKDEFPQLFQQIQWCSLQTPPATPGLGMASSSSPLQIKQTLYTWSCLIPSHSFIEMMAEQALFEHVLIISQKSK